MNAASTPIKTERDDPLERVRRELERDAEHAPRLTDLARAARLTASQLTRQFRARFGLTPKAYLHAVQRDRFKRALRQGTDVSSAIYLAGYGSSSRLYEKVDTQIGMTPQRYRHGGAGLEIRYTVVDTALGKLLVATTERGICAVSLGDSTRVLVDGLRAEFTAATLSRVDEGAHDWLAAMIARVTQELGMRRGKTPPPVPTDVRATAFQWRVWQALMRIPRGETRSYTDIARAIGKPRAVRAVASACASNRLAIVVPCHRVIREDGSLGGYRWGLPRKQRVLRAEGGLRATRDT
jgi:AraC family transcriptional regulator of adaptative response/methylated-DNA-[protein]-cysteine methyltransferase